MKRAGKSRRYLEADKVRYLVFEGGGGKGAAYEGVFEALTEHKLLQKRGANGANRLLGVAGASAGALTALYVALGFTLEDLRKEMSFDFTTFLDSTEPGRMRATRMRPQSSRVQSYLAHWGPAPAGGQRWNEPFDHPDPALIAARADKSLALAKGWTVKLAQAAVLLAWDIYKTTGIQAIRKINTLPLELVADLVAMLKVLETGKLPRRSPFDAEEFPDALLSLGGTQWNKIGKPYFQKIYGSGPADLGRSIHALSYDRGLFVGVEMREYCARTLKKWLPLDSLDEARELSFRRFCTLTNCDLRVSGTNITRRTSAYFSKQHTPDFPVAEAIALSMSIPFVFKPVLINYAGAANISDEPAYAGLWVDGGLLNNLPIHAFDDVAGSGRPAYELPLNEATLAFRLSPGKRPETNPALRMPAGEHGTDALFCEFTAHGADVLATLLSPAEEGQLRSKAEQDQTIEIYCGDLSTLDFSSDEETKKYGNADARNAVRAYFLGKKLGEK